MAALFPGMKGSSPRTLCNTNPWERSSKIHQRNMFLLVPLPPVLLGSMHQWSKVIPGCPRSAAPGVWICYWVAGSQAAWSHEGVRGPRGWGRRKDYRWWGPPGRGMVQPRRRTKLVSGVRCQMSGFPLSFFFPPRASKSHQERSIVIPQDDKKKNI